MFFFLPHFLLCFQTLKVFAYVVVFVSEITLNSIIIRHFPILFYKEYVNSEDEDYSLSVSAVIQRRASIRGRKKGYISPRRASSPMGHASGVGGIGAGNSIVVAKTDRRRSSVYTTSSGEWVLFNALVSIYQTNGAVCTQLLLVPFYFFMEMVNNIIASNA